MNKRRDDYGWLTYPFWTALNRLVNLLPAHYYKGRLGDRLYFFVATEAYGEDLRWQLSKKAST